MSIYEKIKDLEGWLTPAEAELLFKLAKSTKNQGEIVEIGSWKGRSTICLAAGSRLASSRKIHAIDPHVSSSEHSVKDQHIDTFGDFLKNIKAAGVADLIEPIRGYSHEVSAIFDRPVELLFIDALHKYESVLEDFNDWFPKIIEGGVVALHDSAGGAWDGPTRVANEKIFSGRNFKNVGFTDSISYGTKVAENTVADRARNRRILLLKKVFVFLRQFRKIKYLKPFRSLFKKVFKGLQK